MLIVSRFYGEYDGLLVKDWMDRHRSELLQIWETQQFKQLPPLD